jgi:carbon monoxide dehydrogenase subunit G
MIVDVDRATVFAFVSDPARLAQCIPGCSDLREVAPGRYAAQLTSRVSFITLKFKVVAEIVKMEPPSAIEVKLTGDAIGLAGRLVAGAAIELAEAGEQRTTIRYSAEVTLSGKLGGLGQPVFRAKSAELAQEFATNLKAALERKPGEVPA